MLTMSKLSVLGLYNYGQYSNDDLFSEMVMPADIIKEDVIYTILEQCAEFEVIYPDYDYLKMSIGLWSRRWNRTFSKWVKALSIDYDPLYNYDRTEEWTEDETGTGNTKSSGSNSNQSDNLVVAYESDTLHEKERDTVTGTNTIDSDINTTRNNIRKGRTYGNIGVTTSQQMLESELDIAKFNLIQQIVDIFKTEFCILVY